MEYIILGSIFPPILISISHSIHIHLRYFIVHTTPVIVAHSSEKITIYQQNMEKRREVQNLRKDRQAKLETARKL